MRGGGEEGRRRGGDRRGGEKGRRRYGECLGELERMKIGECKRLGGEKRSMRERESKEGIQKRVKERWKGKDGRIREVDEELI